MIPAPHSRSSRTRNAHYRIGTAEREHAASLLAEHYAQGRLDHEEYDERLDAVWTARTHADLAILFTDLPALAPPRPPAQVASPIRRRSLPWLPILVVLIVLSAIVGQPLWLLIFLVPLLNQTLFRRPPRHPLT